MASVVSRVDTGHRDMVHDAQVNYYGTRLATCSSDRMVKVFEIKPNGQSFLLAELTGHEGPVWQLAWSHPKYESVLASCSYDHKVLVWKEGLNGKFQKTYEYNAHEASVNSVSFAPHQYGLILACASTDQNLSFLYYMGDGQWETKKVMNAHSQGCNSISWCPVVDAGSLIDPHQTLTVVKRCVSAGNDFLVKIWKEGADKQWSMEKKLEGHTDWVRDVAWAPAVGRTSNTIASCGQDKRVIIWKCANVEAEGACWEAKVLKVFDDVVWHVSWSLCSSMLAVSSGDNKVSVWIESLEGDWTCISESDQTDAGGGRGNEALG